VTASLHRYGRHRSQVAELSLPDGPGPHPVAALIHGGCWRPRYDRHLMDDLATDLAARGWAAWNMEYRRVGPRAGGGWPATFDDVAAAVEALPIEASRIVAMGNSAGGQLAVWAAGRTAVTGVVSQAGALDLRELWRLGTSDHVVRQLLGGAPDEVPERYEAASPRVPVGVPTLLVHGARDEDVPVSMSRDFAAVTGDGCDLVIIDDEGHYEHLEPGSRCWQAVVEWL
jgi:acetyl esterase/lipase